MRSLRIARISQVYGSPTVARMYAEDSGSLVLKTYDEQLARILHEKVHYSDAFEKAMRELGHEALGIVSDIEPLQRAWAKEHGVDWSREGPAGTVLAQLKAWKPDAVCSQDLFSLPHHLRKNIKTLVPSVKATVVFKGSPGGLEEAGGSDLVFAATPHFVEAFKKLGFNTRLLPHSFDDSIWRSLRSETGDDRPHPVTFAGMSGYGWGLDFQSRYWTLRLLFEKIAGFEAWTNERETVRGFRFRMWKLAKSMVDVCPDRLLQELARSSGGSVSVRRVAAQTLFWREALAANRVQFPEEPLFRVPRPADRPLKKLFPERCHAPVYGLDMFRLLGRSRIVFNRHADFAAGIAGNIRLFEATGMGACLVTERCGNIGDLFREGSEVVTYATASECADKIRYLIAHPAECGRIAQAGQTRTLRDHTPLNRAQTVSDELQKIISGP